MPEPVPLPEEAMGCGLLSHTLPERAPLTIFETRRFNAIQARCSQNRQERATRRRQRQVAVGHRTRRVRVRQNEGAQARAKCANNFARFPAPETPNSEFRILVLPLLPMGGDRVGEMAMKRVHGEIQGERLRAQEEVFALVLRIPRGRVMSYGQISGLMDSRLSPRAVGWMLHRCPEGLPWQRVVNASGGCSTDRLPDFPKGLQRSLLEGEGIEFRANGTLDMEIYRWWPDLGRNAG